MGRENRQFLGPQPGILFGRRRLSESLPADRLAARPHGYSTAALRPFTSCQDCSDDSLPSMANGHMSRWEVGTQNYEAL